MYFFPRYTLFHRDVDVGLETFLWFFIVATF